MAVQTGVAQILALKEQINAQGFRHWYEGELIRAFGYVALGLVLILFGVTALEMFWSEVEDGWLWRLLKVVGAFLGVGLGGICWLQFSRLIARAEIYAKQAVCPNCKAYGRLIIKDERFDPQTLDRQFFCQCNKCSHQWTIRGP